MVPAPPALSLAVVLPRFSPGLAVTFVTSGATAAQPAWRPRKSPRTFVGFVVEVGSVWVMVGVCDAGLLPRRSPTEHVCPPNNKPRV